MPKNARKNPRSTLETIAESAAAIICTGILFLSLEGCGAKYTQRNPQPDSPKKNNRQSKQIEPEIHGSFTPSYSSDKGYNLPIMVPQLSKEDYLDFIGSENLDNIWKRVSPVKKTDYNLTAHNSESSLEIFGRTYYSVDNPQGNRVILSVSSRKTKRTLDQEANKLITMLRKISRTIEILGNVEIGGNLARRVGAQSKFGGYYVEHTLVYANGKLYDFFFSCDGNTAPGQEGLIKYLRESIINQARFSQNNSQLIR